MLKTVALSLFIRRFLCCAGAAVFAIFTITPLKAAAAALPPSVTHALKAAGIALNNVSIVVQAVDGKDAEVPLVAHNDNLLMNPASTMKLVTTYAGLELLGPAYTWKTEALIDGVVKNGVLEGNLYLRGSGDPRFKEEQLWLLLRQLSVRGIKEIKGDLVLDRRAFLLPPHQAASFDNQPLRPYNVGPDALLINLNSLHLTLQANEAKQSVQVLVETPSDALRINQQLTLSAGSCGDWREKIKISATEEALDLQGSFPAACQEKALYIAPWPANVQVERLFRALWRELASEPNATNSGVLRGQVRAGSTPETARLMAVQESAALSEIVRDINKYSNNVMARQLFLNVDTTRPATPEGARTRINAWLAAKNIRPADFVLDNGSGLSRSERVTAKAMSQMLRAAWSSPVMPELMSSLPLAGFDGTLKNRLGSGAASGRAHLKTGYLEGVRAIAGYVLDQRGQRWVVVFLINDAKALNGKAAMDALLNWVADA